MPLRCGSAIRVFHGLPSKSVKTAREWYPLSATHSAGSSEEGGAPTLVRLRCAASKVSGDRGCVALVSWVHLSRDHRPGVQVNGVFGLVGQVDRAVLQARDPRLGIGLADPLLV